MLRIIHRIPVDRLVTLLGFTGLALFLALYNSAFPSAALHMTRSRAEITRIANQYLVDMGYNPQGYQFTLTFSSDSSSSIFLQRTVGIPETNRLIEKEHLPFWYWHARWFKIKQEEEFSLDILPDGTVSDFSHTIPETDPGASLKQEDALAIAKKYLTETQGWDLTKWEQADASSSDRPARRDHAFAWKRRDFNVGDAQLRLSVSIRGDRVGYYSYWFRVPNEYYRTYSEQRNLPNFINNTAYEIGMVGFSIIAIAMLIFPLMQRLNLLRGVLPLALLVGLVCLLADINYLFIARAWYGTTQDWTLYWTQMGFNLLEELISTIFFVGLILAGGRYIARQVWPRQDKILPRGPDRWGTLARSSWRGFMLGGVLLGYAVLFYLVATRLFGGWTPMSVDYSSGFATPMPFIFPLESGLLAASQEEILFRLVGISLIMWWTRKKWLALLIPGALWAFAHLSYIRDPFYLRGIELLITAVFIEGLFFLYFDLTTTIVAHMTYNAMLGALPLLRSNDPYLIFSGVLMIVLLLSPVILGMLRTWQTRRTRAHGSPQIRPATPEDIPQLAGLPLPAVDWPDLFRNPCAVVLALENAGALVGVTAGEVAGAAPEGEAPVGAASERTAPVSAAPEAGAAAQAGAAGPASTEHAPQSGRMTAPQSGRVITIYVDRAWRGQFWGSRLVDALWLQLSQLGAQGLSAAVPAGRRPVYALLSTLGWQTSEQILSRQESSPAGLVWEQAGISLKKSFRRNRDGKKA